MHRVSATKATILVLALALTAGCADQSVEDPVQIAIVEIDGQSISLADFNGYLQSNLVPIEDPSEEDGRVPLREADAVQSRLFDTFVNERLLVHEAERRGLSASEKEIDLYVRSTQDEAGGTVSGHRRMTAGQRLTLSALEEAIAKEQPRVSDEDAAGSLAQIRAEASDERRVRFRSLRFDKLEDAQRAYSTIGKGRNSFDEILVLYALPPEQGIPVEMSWSELSPKLRDALESLRRGAVSEPTELDGVAYLFRVESWSVGPPPETTQALEDAREELGRKRSQKAYADLLQRLRRETRIEIHVDRLPFRYSADS